jgi:hypothetical protein
MNPNIVNVTIINGNTSTTSLTTTSATSLVSNAAASSKVYKIDSIVVANTSASAANIAINVYSAAALGGTAFPIASTISVPAYASLIVTDKTTSFYLLEDKSIGATAGTATALVVTASWEEIS